MGDCTPADYKRFVRIMEFEHDPIAAYISDAMSSSHPQNEIVYHYTSANGLRGILETECLWATQITYLNDLSEMHYGMRFLKEKIAAFSHDFNVRSNKDHPGDKLKGILLSFMNDIWKPPKDVEIYTVSFCEDGDLASLWQTDYGNRGNGYAIGFSSRHLLRAEKLFKLAKVIYEERKQREIINKCLQITIDQASKLFDNQNLHINATMEWLTNKLYYALLPILPFFKSNEWRDEREWRIVTPGVDGAYKLRDDKIPYHEFKISSNEMQGVHFLPIKEIIIGPLISAEELTIAKGICFQRGYGDIEFKRSNVLLRS